MSALRFIVVVVALLAVPMVSRAVVVQPSAIDIAVLPGTTESAVFAVGNDTSLDATFSLAIVYASVAKDGGWTFTDAALPWLTLDRTTVQLAPGERTDVTITAAPPANALDGVSTFGILVHDTGASSGGGLSLGTGFVTLAFVTVGDPGAASTTCANVRIERTGRIVTTSAALTNNGSGILQSGGMLEFRDALPREIAMTVQWNPARHRVLPGQTRELVQTNVLPWHIVGSTDVTIVSSDVTCEALSLAIPPSPQLLALAATVLAALAGLGIVAARRARRA